MPKLWKIDNEMRRWCALLEEEVATWPQVKTRPMFGMIALYRGQKIFAALPRTRAPRTANSLLIKLPGAKEKSLTPANVPGAGWVTFELESENAITDALRWLERAYKKAKGKAP
jgi:hypothetical protein